MYSKMKLRYFNREPKVYEVIYDEDEDYTDEIEKALWDIKDSMDLPTEEVEIAVATRQLCRTNKIK
jgi:hypothetical protein